METQNNKAVLLLADGTHFYGKPAGKIGTTTGELCFNTGMTGYQEIFTDPSYYNQIVVMTNVHIGNYGILGDDQESSNMKIAGMVCRNFNVRYSRKRAENNIQNYFEEESLVSICEVDTRAIVRHIRDKGAMNAIISSENYSLAELKEQLDQVPSMEGLELASQVSTKEAYYIGEPASNTKIAVLDVGVKQNILRNLAKRGSYLKVFPAKTSFEEMQSWNPDGYFISNGPGDPQAMDYAIKTVQEIINADVPLFGICLGHQLICLAMGLKTYKMHNGHRGINHPVKNLIKGTCEITSQNHGFVVATDDISSYENIETTHVNLNDDSLEGICLLDRKVFSVQFHPEAAPGPHDSTYLFDDFITMIRDNKVYTEIKPKLVTI